MGMPKFFNLGRHIVEHGVVCTHVIAFNVNIILIFLLEFCTNIQTNRAL